MKTLATPQRALRLLAVSLVVALAFSFVSASRADASAPPQTIKEVATYLVAASRIGGGPVKGQYGGGGVAWCGMFAKWVLEQTGTNLTGNLAKTYPTANAWPYYAREMGGYVRDATTGDAMPGDLLIFGYKDRPEPGGHIAVVVESAIDGDYNRVRIIAGNESNRVKTRETKLTDPYGKTGRNMLVTVPPDQLRNDPAKAQYQQIAGKDGGSISYRRYITAFGPILEIKNITLVSGQVLDTPQKISSAGFVVKYTNVLNQQPEFGMGDAAGRPIATMFMRNIQLLRSTNDGGTWATLTYS